MASRTVEERFRRLHKGITEGVRKAVLRHKLAGRSIAVWENGRVVKMPPERIPVGKAGDAE